MEYKRLKIDECREGIFNIRRKVFIEEQNCPENMEWDENEEKDSIYFVAFRGDSAVGCLRLRDVEKDLLKMERVAVLKEYRRRGIASNLIREAMLYTQSEAPNSSIYAYAQVTALQAYVSLGFTVLSKVWIEDGTFIPHQTIFWGTPVSIDLFLKNQSEKPDTTYEEYDTRHSSLRAKINEFKQRIESLDSWNFCSLHLLLEDRVVSKIVRKEFENLCFNVSRLFDQDIQSTEIPGQCEVLLKLADTKLNTGHFSDVDENWRRLYALICFIQSFILLKKGKFEAAIKIADRGLCMGRIEEEVVPLRQLAWLIHENIPNTSSERSIHPNFQFQDDSFPAMKSLFNSAPIDECDDSDENSFERLISAVHNEKPILIRQHATNMPATQKWTFPFLLQELHSRTFPVEIGTKYSDEDWSQKMMSFKEFIENLQNEQIYLAQHRLFDQVPHLKHDVIIPDICYGKSINSENVDMNIWIGPSNTVSPLHTDPRKNMFVQVHGSKIFRLVASSKSEMVYPFEGILSNTSQVDVESPDLSKFPDFTRCTVLDAVVRPGDALYIPEKWWHFVRSVTPSISISFWFD